ncbi:MAG TPA: chemotaxis protein CheW [Sideroxyarcus sp.]|nr:chemotaxis protein CheW [Sideroxyarcus sp.]
MNTLAPVRHTISTTSALLRFSGLYLALPQQEILAIEAMAEIDPHEAEPHSIGWLTHAQQRWPVYCLSAELALLTAVPGERRVCVLLGAEDGCVGIVCDEISIEQTLDQRHELPPAMCVPHTPVQGLVVLGEDRIACVSDATRLAAYVAGAVVA